MGLGDWARRFQDWKQVSKFQEQGLMTFNKSGKYEKPQGEMWWDHCFRYGKILKGLAI